ncbi:hypothetical protein MSPP1_001394 [Malassezia sp. CBS 17886]|nr:hypothetical protein MSPP1_001394 [Malassezia sp. CBS 17886]
MATTASVYNFERTTRQILKRHRKDAASFIVHIHPHYMRFEKQDGCFMFDSRTKDFLHYIRDQTLPVDLVDVFQQAGVPFFEGCLMVEVHEHRKIVPPVAHEPAAEKRSGDADTQDAARSLFYLREGGRYGRRHAGDGRGASGAPSSAYPGPDGVEVYRIILRPTSESLWNDLQAMDAAAGGTWSDDDALRIEAMVVVCAVRGVADVQNLTVPPLCLTPDPHAMHMANLMLSSTVPNAYYPLSPTFQPYRRDKATGWKLNSVERELARSQDARHEQIMALMKDGWVLSPRAGPSGASTAELPVNDASSFVPTCVLRRCTYASFSRLDFLRNWRQTRGATRDASPSAGDAVAHAAKAADTKSPAKRKGAVKTGGTSAPAPAKAKTPGADTRASGAASPTDSNSSKGRPRAKRRKTEDQNRTVDSKARAKPAAAPAAPPAATQMPLDVFAAYQQDGATPGQARPVAHNAFDFAQMQAVGRTVSSPAVRSGDEGLTLSGAGAIPVAKSTSTPGRSVPGLAGAAANGMMANGAMLHGFGGTPTLGVQALPSAFSSPQQHLAEHDGAWFHT